MKLARQIATITYRSGPEWDQRFGRNLRKLSSGEEAQLESTGGIRRPALCPDFLIETYLDHQVRYVYCERQISLTLALNV